jgi:predicted nucleic acid-binding protein
VDTVLMAFLAARGRHFREVAILTVRSILQDQSAEVLHQTHDFFLAGLAHNENQLDKGYSLTDCDSMNVVRARGLTEVLTNDEHFRQEGFNTLL